MKESNIKRNRKCRRCPATIYGDAQRMKQHEAEHKVVERAQAAGLVVPRSSKVTGVFRKILTGIIGLKGVIDV